MQKSVSQAGGLQGRSLLEQVRGGDQGAFDVLLGQYKPLISALVATAGRKLSSMTDFEREELYQEATILFYNAALNFDTEQTEVEFGLYAKICMENGLTSLIRRMRKDRMVSDSAEDLLERYDDGRTEDPADAVIEKESGEALFAFIEKNLSAYEMRIWTLYLSGYTAKEIAVRLEKKTDAGTVKSVTNAIYRVRRKLRSLLGGS